ncbi:MAG: helix-turn-helix domain-containing protein [Ruminococcus sp.]|nr:helix-turn-helix domain-containing protein [Ruminococcus sp.]
MIYKERLKELRETNELKQTQLADILSIKSGDYSQYEREYTIIPIKHLNSLCNYFNVSIDYIFNLTATLNYKDTSKDINKKLSGQRLKELRKEIKLTQKQFANLLNVSNTTISEYECGNNTIATPFLYTICTKYHISADYLLGRINNPKYLK